MLCDEAKDLAIDVSIVVFEEGQNGDRLFALGPIIDELFGFFHEIIHVLSMIIMKVVSIFLKFRP